jgi:hypothetical protein
VLNVRYELGLSIKFSFFLVYKGLKKVALKAVFSSVRRFLLHGTLICYAELSSKSWRYPVYLWFSVTKLMLDTISWIILRGDFWNELPQNDPKVATREVIADVLHSSWQPVNFVWHWTTDCTECEFSSSCWWSGPGAKAPGALQPLGLLYTLFPRSSHCRRQMSPRPTRRERSKQRDVEL